MFNSKISKRFFLSLEYQIYNWMTDYGVAIITYFSLAKQTQLVNFGFSKRVNFRSWRQEAKLWSKTVSFKLLKPKPFISQMTYTIRLLSCYNQKVSQELINIKKHHYCVCLTDISFCLSCERSIFIIRMFTVCRWN